MTVSKHTGGYYEYCFRPLAGINYDVRSITRHSSMVSFRPLAGINYDDSVRRSLLASVCFRPLAGINYDKERMEIMKNMNEFPSPRGDKL